MNEELRRRYVRDLVTDLQQVGGARFEQWIRPLWDHLAGGPVQAYGLNVQGTPVAGHLDALWPDGSVAEATTDQTFFQKPYKKARNDFAHARREAPQARKIRLFTNREPTAPAVKLVNRTCAIFALRGFMLDLWDGRRIAEYIVDQLLLDERFVERVGDALPNLRRISEQAAANARLPALSASYEPRGDEAALALHLQAGKSLLLAGMGGVGKTELACAIAHRLRDEFELVVWLDAERVNSLESLLAYDVRLNGYRLNILGLLKAHRTLLVLDNLTTDLNVVALEAECGEHSRILITSQVAFGPAPQRLEFLSREVAAAVLSRDAPVPCPDQVVTTILAEVGAHPLILRLLNRLAVEGHDWALVAEQCATVAGLPDEKRQTVASRILEQHLEVLGAELAFFAWCESPRVDRALFTAIFGLGGASKLDRWALTARGQSDAVRLHDVVFASVIRLRHALAIDDAHFGQMLNTFLERHISPKGLPFFRVVNRHRDLLRTRLAQLPGPGVLRYAYLHSRNPTELDAALIGDPAADAAAGPQGALSAWLLSIVESIEADYRRVRDLGDPDRAKTTLKGRMPVYDALEALRTLNAQEVAIVRHHRAKSLLKLGQVEEAVAGFEAILTDGGPHYATRFQLARLLEKDYSRARALVVEIIEAGLDRPGDVPTSVLIETIAILRRRHLRRTTGEMTERFGTFMAQQIKAAACSGDTQPIRAFAAVGPEWSYKAPNLFVEVLQEIDVGTPAEAEDDDERVAIGRLLTASGKMFLRENKAEEAKQAFSRAVSFFAALRRQSGFTATHHADALLRLDRAAEAAEVLDQKTVEKDREQFWLLRRSEAHLALGETGPALDTIDRALKMVVDEFRPTFLAQRAEVRRASGEPDHLDILDQAIDACKDPQYRAELERRRNDRNATRL